MTGYGLNDIPGWRKPSNLRTANKIRLKSMIGSSKPDSTGSQSLFDRTSVFPRATCLPTPLFPRRPAACVYSLLHSPAQGLPLV